MARRRRRPPHGPEQTAAPGPQRVERWAALSGRWTLAGARATFHGPDERVPYPLGLAVAGQNCRDGVIRNDSTTIRFCGQYRAARGRQLRGRRAPWISYGHSKDHRPDLKQLLFALTTSADGGVPVQFRRADGQTNDSRTHIETWEALRQVAGRAERIYRLGMLSPSAPPAAADRATSLLVPTALRELGYVEGQNLVIERRFAAGRLDRLPALARELVQLRVEVIHAIGDPAIAAARGATTGIPIVMGFAQDPVEHGFHPGPTRRQHHWRHARRANHAGGQAAGADQRNGPQGGQIAVLARDDSVSRPQVKEGEKAAALVGVKALVVEVKGRDYDRAFATINGERADALFVTSGPVFDIGGKRIIELAAKHRLPAIYWWRHHAAEDGGLMSYGSDLFLLCRRVAAHIDRIFKGANPADLPVEQPMKFELNQVIE
jgi:putative ABC transport system substrate-binding protein